MMHLTAPPPSHRQILRLTAANLIGTLIAAVWAQQVPQYLRLSAFEAVVEDLLRLVLSCPEELGLRAVGLVEGEAGLAVALEAPEGRAYLPAPAAVQRLEPALPRLPLECPLSAAEANGTLLAVLAPYVVRVITDGQGLPSPFQLTTREWLHA